jgi:hypothetical protein
MSRKLFFTFTLAITAVSAFVGVTRATSSATANPAARLIGNLPQANLAARVQVKISNLVSSEAAAQYGISQDSYRNARLLATTERGPLVAIPGSNGVCLALASSVACGGLPTNELVVASLLVSDAKRQHMVGGGLLSSPSAGVDIVRQGSRTPARAIEGGFVITAADRVLPREELSLVARGK